MSFEAELKAHLQTDGAISGIVEERIHPIILPQQSPMPAITYTLVFGEPQNSIDGFTSGLRRISVQIDCWSRTFDRTKDLAAAVVERLNTPASAFRSVITEYPMLDDYETEAKIYRRSIGASCWFTE